jgi:hypothetical protein
VSVCIAVRRGNESTSGSLSLLFMMAMVSLIRIYSSDNCSPPTLFPAKPRDREKLGSAAITPMRPSEGHVNTSFQFILARPPHVLGARVAMVVVAALRCAGQGRERFYI